MAITSTRVVTITAQGDGFNNGGVFNAANNALSPGSVTIHTLPTGNTVIAFPTGGSSVQGATIVPPATNTNTITVKGTTTDTGVVIHRTDPTSIALDTNTTTQVSLVITVSATVTGLRIFWT